MLCNINKEPSRGLEPRTLGLEVLRAILLRHEGSLLILYLICEVIWNVDIIYTFVFYKRWT